jgi:UDP-N-acetylmuramate--alanine ligase
MTFSYKNIHIIGIGGIGISALGGILQEKGCKISGSDIAQSTLTEELEKMGMSVHIPHAPENIPNDAEVIIFSHAIDDDNVELLRAKEMNLPCISYPEALGMFAEDYNVIAVAGTHGKTTVTAILADILIAGGIDPTVILGGKLTHLSHDKKTPTNFRVGKSNILLIEACEYQESFLAYKPDILLITNIDYDHSDYFPEEADYEKAFYKLIDQMPDKSTIISFADDKKCQKLMNFASSKCTTIPLSLMENGEYCGDYSRSDILLPNGDIIDIKLQIKGVHNFSNAFIAYVTAHLLSCKPEIIKQTLESFIGSWRRMEYHGMHHNAYIYDDYAHHPTEIEATCKAMEEIMSEQQSQRLILVFQPHQLQRTKAFYRQFIDSLKIAHTVLIPNIYLARDESYKGNENEIASILEKIIAALRKEDVEAEYLGNFKKTNEKLHEIVEKKDTVLFMGAGDVYKIINMFINKK